MNDGALGGDIVGLKEGSCAPDPLVPCDITSFPGPLGWSAAEVHETTHLGQRYQVVRAQASPSSNWRAVAPTRVDHPPWVGLVAALHRLPCAAHPSGIKAAVALSHSS